MAQATMHNDWRRSAPGEGGVYQRALERIPPNSDPLGPASVWQRANETLRRAQTQTSRQDDLRRWAALYGRPPRRASVQGIWANRLSCRGYLLVWLLSSLVLSLLCLRFVFRLVSADPLATVVEGVYHASDLLMAPFLGLTELPRLGLGVIDVPALLAMVVYAALALLLIRLLRVFAARWVKANPD